MERLLRWIRNLYWKQTAAVRVENQLCDWIKIERGVRQGCVLSTDLFSSSIEIILRKVEELHGVVINGRNVNNIRYADDTVLIAETERGLQDILNKVTKESESFGLALNAKKTYSMTVSKKQSPPTCTLTASGIEIKHVEKFLGSFLTSDGKSDHEIKQRITLSIEAFNKERSVLTIVQTFPCQRDRES